MEKSEYEKLTPGEKFSSRNNELSSTQLNELSAVKNAVTQLYDLLSEIRKQAGMGDKGRYLSKAISHLENASYDAVRGITIPE